MRSTLLFCLIALCVADCHREKWALPVFKEVTVPVETDLSSVWFTDSLRGYASGGKAWESGFILSTTDGGATWAVDTLMNRKMECIMFDSSGRGYVCGQDFSLYQTPGDAHHWESFHLSYQWARACYFPDPRHGVIVNGESFRGGRLEAFGPYDFWRLDTLLALPNEMASVWFADPKTAVAVGFGWVMRSIDGGQSWVRLELTGDYFNCVRFTTRKTGYICGNSGTILKTTDAGATWKKIRSGASIGSGNQPFTALWFESPENGWIAGDKGLFWHTSDGGNHWEPVSGVPQNRDFTGIFMTGGKGWITAKGGHLYQFSE
jgi:photosystem II stability/assembly factor-like uncharacterized protein